MPRKLTAEEALDLNRNSGMFSDLELEFLKTAHALEALKLLMEGPGLPFPVEDERFLAWLKAEGIDWTPPPGMGGPQR